MTLVAQILPALEDNIFYIALAENILAADLYIPDAAIPSRKQKVNSENPKMTQNCA